MRLLSIFLILLCLFSCRKAQDIKPVTKKMYQADTTYINMPNEDGTIDTGFIVIDKDTAYTSGWTDTPPLFSIRYRAEETAYGDVYEYIRNKLGKIHIGAKGFNRIGFVVSKRGDICHISICKSAGENPQAVTSPSLAARMDSIALDITKKLPRFTPASKKGKLVNYAMEITFEFE